MESDGGRAIAVRADVGIVAEVERLFPMATDTFGAIDVVVSHAGTMPLGRMADGDLAGFDQVMATHPRGALIVLGQAARQVTPAKLDTLATYPFNCTSS
jgi:3-oxoacyl-[acyl-carrier protein] reductase